MTSVRARVLSLFVRVTARPIIAVWAATPDFPWPYPLVDYTGLLPRIVAGTRFRTRAAAGVKVHEAIPAECIDGRRILYFPGGGFLVGGQHLHRGLLSRVAEATSTPVEAVAYRKLPRHPISRSIADCVDVYREMVADSDAREIILMGDSAGGFLVLAILAQAQREGLPMPAAAVALSPLCEVRSEFRSSVKTQCAFFGPKAIGVLLRLAAARELDSEYLHPADLTADDLPPLLMQVARGESLYTEVAELAEQLTAKGADLQLQSWDLDVHVFQAVGWIPEANEAIRHVGEFCSRAWSDSASDFAPRQSRGSRGEAIR